MERTRLAMQRFRFHLNHNPVFQLPVLLFQVAMMAAITIVLLEPTHLKSRAYGETVDIYLANTNELSFNLMLGAKTNQIGFARIVLSFDPSKIKLASDVSPSVALGMPVQVTMLADANTSGKIITALGTTVADRTSPAVGTFSLASLTFTPISQKVNDFTTIAISASDSQVVEMHGTALNLNPVSYTLVLNSQSSLTPTPITTPIPTVTFEPSPTPTSAGGRTVVLTPDADAWVARNHSKNNYGSDKQLVVRGSNPITTYVKFNVSIPSGATITSAFLRMHVCTSNHNCASAANQNIRPVSSIWSEDTINYDNRPAAETIVANYSGGTNGEWIATDVTNSVVGNNGGEVSFELDQSSADGIYFDSKEAGSGVSPQLVITYTP
jgi:hypothetical protein